MDSNVSLLGMAKKAGALTFGEESTAAAARRGKARVVLSACDASERSVRQARAICGARVPHMTLPYTKEEIGAAIGRGETGIIAITDVGLAAGFAVKLAQSDPISYGDAAAELEVKAKKAQRRRREADAHKRNKQAGKRRIT
jgi:ribosomal protein L7Ae-like RNA K-turn-binding protein